MEQYGIPAAYIRGGTSKPVFLSKSVIPSPGPLRDRVLKRIMGSPDPMQIDGIGGTRVVTSKIAIVSPSTREGIDVDYEFAQVGISQDDIATMETVVTSALLLVLTLLTRAWSRDSVRELA
jgi:2-methylaconitate cis-trans-isomerase PrpF